MILRIAQQSAGRLCERHPLRRVLRAVATRPSEEYEYETVAPVAISADVGLCDVSYAKSCTTAFGAADCVMSNSALYCIERSSAASPFGRIRLGSAYADCDDQILGRFVAG
jgi:hypothetical protein